MQGPLLDPTRKDAMDGLPYRPCVGVMLINRDGLVWTGRRHDGHGRVDPGFSWQMPQGGIDAGEDPLEAARRELYEETSVASITLLAEAPDWFSYDFPEDVILSAKRGKYRGQAQKWYAFRFDGDDSEINILQPPEGHSQEFSEWRWENASRLPGLIVPFKRRVYEEVIAAFAHLTV